MLLVYRFLHFTVCYLSFLLTVLLSQLNMCAENVFFLWISCNFVFWLNDLNHRNWLRQYYDELICLISRSDAILFNIVWSNQTICSAQTREYLVVMTLVLIYYLCCSAVMLKNLMAELNVCIDFKMKMKQNTKVLSFFYDT